MSSPKKPKTVFLTRRKEPFRFVSSSEALELKRELDEKVEKFKTEILTAALIENIKCSRAIIEYLIAGKDEKLRQALISA